MGCGINTSKNDIAVHQQKDSVKQYQMIKSEIYLKKGQIAQLNIYGNEYDVKYTGLLNKDKDLEVYFSEQIVPLKVGKPFELGYATKTGQKVEVTALELIAQGEDKEGIVHMLISAPKVNQW
jgi:hypothetical protein